jgi:hypothetical protein
MRQRDPLSPEESRELDALERALAGDPVDSDLRELEQLVNDIRATAPEMSPGFAARLEHEVAEGFPQSQERPASRRPARRRWVLIPAGGVLAAALVALVVVLGAGSNDDDPATIMSAAPSQTASGTTGPTVDSAGSPADEAAPAAAAKAAPAAPPASGAGSGSSAGGGSSSSSASSGAAADRASSQALQRAPSTSGSVTSAPRKQERSALLALRVPNSKVDSTSDGVIRTVDRFGGIIASSSSATQGSHGEANFELRIPTDKLDDALAALSRLGHVTERQQNLVDITGSFTSAQDRLSDARAERRGLLKALGRATTQQQIDSLKARLRNVRSQIARLNGDLDALRRRADLSSVSLVVRGTAAEPGGGSGSGGGGWSPGDAAHDAVRVLEVIAGVALIALAIAAPLGLLAVLVAIAVRVTRRRRREAALDPA